MKTWKGQEFEREWHQAMADWLVKCRRGET